MKRLSVGDDRLDGTHICVCDASSYLSSEINLSFVREAIVGLSFFSVSEKECWIKVQRRFCYCH
jgi:hypothetical protein